MFVRPQLQIVNMRPAEDSLAHYVGPLRIDQFRVHSYYEVNYSAAKRDPFGNEGEPFYAEFRVQVEPRVLVASIDPPKAVVAIDDLGQSQAKSEKPSVDGSRHAFQPITGLPATIRIPLARPMHNSHALKKFSGVLPMELAILPNEPSLVVPLADAAGKTFRSGDVLVDVQESRALPNNGFKLKLSAKVVAGPEQGQTTEISRRNRGAILSRQIEVVDSNGAVVSGSGSIAHAETTLLDMTYFGSQAGSGPKELRIYSPKFVRWEAPFAFEDLPLP